MLPLAVAAAFAGLVDGSIRALGVDPSLFLLQARYHGVQGALVDGMPGANEIPAVLGCVTRAVFFYVAIGLGVAAIPALAVTLVQRLRGARWRGAVAVGGSAAAWGLGVWASVSLYWWSRPVIFAGLSVTDPKRLGAAAAILLLGLVIARVLVYLVGPSRWRPGGTLSLILAVPFLVGAGLTLFQWQAEEERGTINDRNRDLPNVLLVIVDALRQDTISAYGDPDVHTPNIDRLAAEGVLFENAFAPAPFTWPSVGSILTGKSPRRHGLMKMEPGVKFPTNATLPLLLEMAEREDGVAMTETDWIEGAFMTGTLSHGSGLAEGFDVYLEALVGHELVNVHDRWSHFRSGLLPWIVRNKLEQKGDRQLVTTTTERWLEQNAERRFLSFVHLYSTHTPYNPAEEFRERHLDPNYDGPFDAFVAANREAIEEGEYTPTPEDVKRIERLYLAGVEEADAMIGRLVSKLQTLDLLDDTIVIITSDHGESLGEHGLWEHNWMYQDNLRVPLVMRFPKGLPAGKRVPAIVDSIDIVPTVLDLMGLKPPVHAKEAEATVVEMTGWLDVESPILWDAIDGSSLAPLTHGTVDSVRPLSFSENGRFMSAQGPVSSSEGPRWKLIVRRELLRGDAWDELLRSNRKDDGVELPRLFDLEADPLELQNLFDVHDPALMAEAQRLFGALLAESEALPIREEQVIQSGRDMRAEALFKELGYGGGIGIPLGDPLAEREE